MSIIDLSAVEKDRADFLVSGQLIDHFFVSSMNSKELCENFRIVMDKARELGNAEQVEEVYKSVYQSRKADWRLTMPELWEAPRPFETDRHNNHTLPDKCLPEPLWGYLTAVSEHLQVTNEMCILPLLSVLSLCVQGKAVIKHPSPNNSHTETLNLYTLTIADPSDRKSPVFSEFMDPVNQYENRYNDIHAKEINDYKARKKVLESREKRLLSSPKGIDEEQVKLVQSELAGLKPVNKLCMNITDATPEALTQLLLSQGERLGLLDGEGGVFDTISGIYTGGKANIDVFLKAYSGEKCVIVRVTRGETHLSSPLLTMGLMTQPKHFIETLNNKKFMGRGLMHRFMYSFPKSIKRNDFASSDIPSRLRAAYHDIVNKLIDMKQYRDKPVLIFDKESSCLLHDYSDKAENRREHYKLIDDDMSCWYGKQFGRCMKIAGLLHLCEHEPAERVTADTALKAIKISEWAESQAEKAFGVFEQEQENKNAEYILRRLKEKKIQEMSKREIRRIAHKNKNEIEPLLELLEAYGYVKEKIDRNVRYPNSKVIYQINPCIFED